MTKYIPLLLIAGITLLVSEQAYSQKAVTADSSFKLFNEGGYVRGVTLARALGLMELTLGLLSLTLAIGAKRRWNVRGAKIALGLGFSAVVLSAIHFFVTAGAVFGSGSGKAGAIIALIFGLIGGIIAFQTIRTFKINDQD